MAEQYLQKHIDELPTPAFLINAGTFETNSRAMLDRAKALGASFRAHVKTHKTVEGTRLQLQNQTSRIVVSTFKEVEGLSEMIREGTITDILYGLPISKSWVPVADQWSRRVTLRLMIDDIEQLKFLVEYSKTVAKLQKWSIFLKIDMGTHRAGRELSDHALKELIGYCMQQRQYIDIHGTYCHAGHSYNSEGQLDAKKYLQAEIIAANEAAKIIRSFDSSLTLCLSIGATPTAHVADHNVDLSGINASDDLELHAGNYPMCDLQQLSTGCITQKNISCSVLAEVVSSYPGRGSAPGEVLINAGVIALAREPGKLPGWGRVITEPYNNWFVARLSQEHGILAATEPTASFPAYGTKLKIVPQHACISATSFPSYYIVDDFDIVIAVWTPFHGW
ncbi:hypothetical protein CANCADRAFT_122518 [Tortispora caseinolytica NRRL Y-17796]|uniref:D-serine dehydratase n=1 Tax=Tortispora caseinolytica NRRL Y-17796 TaxID=767744 RepID=A0A1E4THV7_9ASCO|nr:hypothetical protein CANCADRAFT_122518 [Tortispora caseinolytica NRRL Y-17796]